ncbi:hypothetical protein UFOVP450_174 [uncultured Caudovirales phage]|uniref:Uncharacterized protein n=1 Tax=uncultured Caudovirales phage TaxID=2100421 RepID=A0A6J5MBB7_9CAUD|nr:hypothetical protein UFOVP450_174 [uncultured Caudovirales phage]
MKTSHIIKRLQEDTAYQEFFKKAMDKFGINSIGDLSGDKKKEFFNYIDTNYKGKEETNEGYMPSDSSVSREVQAVGKQIDVILSNFSAKFQIPSQDLSELADLIWEYAAELAFSRIRDMEDERSF